MLARVHRIHTDESETASRVRTELAAMRAIAAALEGLPDDDARARVIRWASDLFGVRKLAEAGSFDPAPANAPDTPAGPDASLAVSDLESFFEPTSRSRTPHKEFEDDRDVGIEGFESPQEVAPPQPPQPSGPVPVAAAAPRPKGVSSKLQGFVSDFQKLARDWRDD
jgi:hypothetical protein